MALRFELAQEGVRAHGELRHGHRGRTRSRGRRGRRCDRVADRDLLPPRARRRREQASHDLRYGENPHQPAAWYVPADVAAADLPAVLQGKELSFTNLLDVDAAAASRSEFAEPAAVVVKHTNPCGVATGASLDEAYVRARDADPLSAFGGIVGCNREIDEATAQAIASTFIEAVIAPGHHRGGPRVLAAKKNLRVVDRRRSCSAARAEPRASGGSTCAPPSAACSPRNADRVIEARDGWPARRAARTLSPSARRPRPSGRRCGSHGGSART